MGLFAPEEGRVYVARHFPSFRSSTFRGSRPMPALRARTFRPSFLPPKLTKNPLSTYYQNGSSRCLFWQSM